LHTVVLLTSGQPATNPRLVKEADALSQEGYKVIVIYQYRTEWASKLDEKILKDSMWESICVGGNPISDNLIYLKSKLFHKLAKLLVKYFGFKNKISELALGRCVSLLTKKAKSLPADLYIAHNLGALPAAVLAAKKNNAKCGFDAEDFHRNENSDDAKHPEVLLNIYIENKYLPKLNYLTTSSPLISEAYQLLYPTLTPQTILNVFPKQDIRTFSDNNPKLKLFWFSQTIGFSRGLEDVIKAMGMLKSNFVELHMLGSINLSTKKAFENFAKEKGVDHHLLFFYPPIQASEIFSFASQFDIGLATEIGVPYNRDLCLTNKIFTYIHAGLATIASDTTAQMQLLTTFKEMGMIYERKKIKTLHDIFYTYLNDKKMLKNHKINAKRYANEELNWDIEKDKFISLVKKIVQH
jgi:glycosyltransferase involved in cell wall biosynthesis